MRALEDKLRRALGAERVVLGRKLQTLWDGYGEIRRAALEGLPLAGGMPESAVVKLVQPRSASGKTPAELRSHRRKLRSYDVEQQFYRRFASRCGAGCRVARPLHLERSGDGWLFVLEDLHWSDYATLDLVSLLARRSESARFLLLGTYQPEVVGASGHPLPGVISALQLHHYCRELSLSALSAAEAEAYLTRQIKFDPDCWIIEVEDRAGRNFLDLVVS